MSLSATQEGAHGAERSIVFVFPFCFSGWPALDCA